MTPGSGFGRFRFSEADPGIIVRARLLRTIQHIQGRSASGAALSFPAMTAALHPVQACLALGSNLGDRRSHIESGLAAIARLPHTRVLRISQLLETDPVGPIPQPRYLNAAALIETSLTARSLLAQLLEVERDCGRSRAQEQRWGPRTLDLDLILYGDEVINEPGLSVPHPRMHERLFVLAPAAEVAGDMPVPTMNATVKQLLQRLNVDTSGRA